MSCLGSTVNLDVCTFTRKVKGDFGDFLFLTLGWVEARTEENDCLFFSSAGSAARQLSATYLYWSSILVCVVTKSDIQN